MRPPGRIAKLTEDQEERVYFTRMDNETAKNYFCLIFLFDEHAIHEMSTQIVRSNIPNRLKGIDIRTAYALAMRIRINISGLQAVQDFHEKILYLQFRREFRVMALTSNS